MKYLQRNTRQTSLTDYLPIKCCPVEPEYKLIFPLSQVHGSPLHITHSDASYILKSIEQTRIHDNENDKVEFALGVYIHPYPNDVLSVWIYLGTMTPK